MNDLLDSLEPLRYGGLFAVRGEVVRVKNGQLSLAVHRGEERRVAVSGQFVEHER
jgi:hypothetical protein